MEYVGIVLYKKMGRHSGLGMCEVDKDRMWCFELCEIVKESKRTTPGIPTWSPTVVLTRPDDA